ncbi:MAG: hypothetical protein IRZ03_19215 [Acidobacterium ailaaui]|nr:hypothetical protein [Pseudacidobacterium ailaaui]
MGVVKKESRKEREMSRAIYREDQKTRNGHEIVTRECDCDIARRERRRGAPVHRAYKLEQDYTDPTAMVGWTCSKTGMSVTV